jgi:ABC-type polar amino acid transport system ATPase subunit
MKEIIEVKNIHKFFNDKEILKGINFEVNKGDVISIIGPSGSGKTTLLRCLNFLDKANSGSIIFDGVEYNLHSISKKDISVLRKKTAFVFQNFNLFRNKTVIQNIMEGLVTGRKVDKKTAIEIAQKALDKVGLSDKYDFYPNELSGGQQQRVAIARAIATNPEVIYFDEPTSALDPELIGEVLNVMKQLAEEGMTMIVVTHEMNFAKNISSKIIFMDDGKILSCGESSLFFENQTNERIKQFIQKINQKEVSI